jgi:hypothetical protein
MITISILGLDQYIVGRYSKDHTGNLASIFEIEEDEICFYAPSAYIFHNGVEQTSWQTIVKISAPTKYKVLQKNVADYLLKTLAEFSINITVEFNYFEKDNEFSKVNSEYPRYISDDNVAEIEDEGEEELTDADLLNEDKVYTGNAFAHFEEKNKEKK